MVDRVCRRLVGGEAQASLAHLFKGVFYISHSCTVWSANKLESRTEFRDEHLLLRVPGTTEQCEAGVEGTVPLAFAAKARWAAFATSPWSRQRVLQKLRLAGMLQSARGSISDSSVTTRLFSPFSHWLMVAEGRRQPVSIGAPPLCVPT